MFYDLLVKDFKEKPLRSFLLALGPLKVLVISELGAGERGVAGTKMVNEDVWWCEESYIFIKGSSKSQT